MKVKLLLSSLLLAVNAYAGNATWNSNPATNDWNTATNWIPTTVPNSRTDIATFGASNTTAVSTSNSVDLGTLIFAPGAPSYTITGGIRFWGKVRNDSGVEQNLSGGFRFYGYSRAGDNITYNGGVLFLGHSNAASASFNGGFQFTGQSSAGNATIIAPPNSHNLFYYGLHGKGTPSTGNAHITLSGGDATTSLVGANVFLYPGTIIGNPTFIADAATVAGGEGGWIDFYNFGDDNLVGGTFIANGAAVPGAPTYHAGGKIEIEGVASQGSYIINGATAAGGDAGEMTVDSSATAGAAFITVNGGENGGAGGSLTLQFASSGGTARIAVYGNGFLNPNVLDEGATIGSLEGDGLVLLGKRSLTIGSNDLSTTFSGNIQGTGAITKIGSGTLTLTSANSYSGGTTVASGILLVNNSSGSGTGAGAVSVAAGTLGGSGIISRAVTCGTGTGSGALLAPSEGTNEPATFTIQSSLTLNDDSTYVYKLDTETVRADEVIAKGVVIESGATFSLIPSGNNGLATGQVFTVINNTAATAIVGTFHNLADGAIVTVNGSNLQASYSGGDGNDLTLTVVP